MFLIIISLNCKKIAVLASVTCYEKESKRSYYGEGSSYLSWVWAVDFKVMPIMNVGTVLLRTNGTPQFLDLRFDLYRPNHLG